PELPLEFRTFGQQLQRADHPNCEYDFKPLDECLEREVEDHDIRADAVILLGERTRHTLPCADPRAGSNGALCPLLRERRSLLCASPRPVRSIVLRTCVVLRMG